MFSLIWHTLFFDPVYNTLVFFIDVIPHGDVGLAIVATVVLVKTVLLPVSIKAAKTQKIMKEIEPKLKEIKVKFKDDRQAQSKAMMEIYSDAGMNPFASIFLIFLQIPIIIALYFSVYTGGGVALPDINIDLLFSFIPNPDDVSMMMFGVFDIAARSLPLAVVAGLSQFAQMHITIPKLPPKVDGEKSSPKDDFMRTMQLQMKYIMPILIGFVAYSISAAIALYFLVSSLIAIGQEFYIRKHR